MAAGLGFKDFVTGEVLTAADVDGYLMQGVWVFASAAARDAAVTSPQEGNFAYLKDTNVTTYYTGSAWANLDTTGMTNPMTTTGDTIYSSSGSTPARLGIGTAGQVLQVNSGATAPEWATPASGGMTLLSTTTLSGTTTTVTSIDQTYRDLYIEVYGATWGTGASSASFGTNHTSAISFRRLNDASVSSYYLTTMTNQIDDGNEGIKQTGGDNYINWRFFNYASTTDFKTFAITGIYNGSTNNGRPIVISGGIASDTAMSEFKFSTAAGYTFSAGTIKIYGVK